MENDEHRIRFDSGWHGGGVLESLRGRRIDRGGYPHRCGDMGIQKVEKMTLILKKKLRPLQGSNLICDDTFHPFGCLGSTS